MAQNKRFRYFLRKNDTIYYYVAGQSVLTSTERRRLRYSPANWKSTKMSFLRNTKYWGVFREISVALQFIKDAAEILREVYYTEDFEGICILEIEVYNPTTLSFQPFYIGDLNFSTVVDERNYVTLTVLDRGLPALLKSREDTPYEIPIDGDPDAIDVLIDGVKVGGQGSWYPGNYSSDAANGVRFSSIPYTNTLDSINGRSLNLNTGDNITQIAAFIRGHAQIAGITAVTAKGAVQYAYNPGSPTEQDGEYIFHANTDLTRVTIDGQMVVSTKLPNLVGNKIIRVYATVVDLAAPGTGVVSRTVLYEYQNTAVNADVGFLATMSATFDMPINTYLLITIAGYTPLWSGGASPEAFFPIESGYFRVSFLAKVAPTFTKGFRIIDLCKKLIEKLSDAQYSVISNYLSNQETSDEFRKSRWDTLAYHTVITSGDALRSLPNSVIKITWAQLFNFLWASEILVAMPANDGLHIEAFRDAFTQDVIYTLEGANNVTVQPFMEVVANQYKVGYDNYDNENVAGKNEYNTGTTFLHDGILIAPKKEDTSVSPIRFDIYGIESARAETFAENRKDYKADNNLFGLEIDPTPTGGHYILWRPSPAYVAGVDDPVDAYNLGRTPFRALGRKLPFVNSVKSSGSLVFQTTDKNPELVSDLYNAVPSVDAIQETETIPLGVFTYKGRDVSPIFQPRVISLDAISKANLYNLALANPYGLIQFPDKEGKIFKGWVLDVGLNPATSDVYPTRLLSHPDNDLRNLKR